MFTNTETLYSETSTNGHLPIVKFFWEMVHFHYFSMGKPPNNGHYFNEKYNISKIISYFVNIYINIEKLSLIVIRFVFVQIFKLVTYTNLSFIG